MKISKDFSIEKKRETYYSNIASVGARPYVKYVIIFLRKYCQISACSIFELQTDNKDVRIYIDSLSSIA